MALEAPWAGPLRRPAGWDIDIAPFSHLSGAVAGTLCAWALRSGSSGARRADGRRTAAKVLTPRRPALPPAAPFHAAPSALP